jgi:hypothetical protein
MRRSLVGCVADQRHLAGSEALEGSDDLVERLRATGRAPAAAVDDEPLRVLRNLGGQVVEETAERPFLLRTA